MVVQIFGKGYLALILQLSLSLSLFHKRLKTILFNPGFSGLKVGSSARCNDFIGQIGQYSKYGFTSWKKYKVCDPLFYMSSVFPRSDEYSWCHSWVHRSLRRRVYARSMEELERCLQHDVCRLLHRLPHVHRLRNRTEDCLALAFDEFHTCARVLLNGSCVAIIFYHYCLLLLFLIFIIYHFFFHSFFIIILSSHVQLNCYFCFIYPRFYLLFVFYL